MYVNNKVLLCRIWSEDGTEVQ